VIEPVSVATGAASWLWEKYGARTISKVTDATKAKWSKLSWPEQERRYKARLLDEHSTTKLLGNPKEIRLDLIYTDVYVLDQVSAFRRLDVEDMKKQQFNRTGLPAYVIRKPLLKIAEESKRIYILGKPGAGKSTFLKTVVRLSCEGRIDKTAIFVPLKRWSDSSKSLLEFMADEFAICDFPDAQLFITELLTAGQAIVLFDGLDEVSNSDSQRQKAIHELSQFSRKYHNSKILLTCRTAATEYSFEKFTYVEIADFTPEQQESFISKWYSDRPDSREKLLNEWRAKESEGLVDLARTPLLLALLCLAYDATLTFPRRRVELYEEAVNALLRKWDSSREIPRDEVYRGLSHNRKEQMLRRLALETFKDAEILISKRRLINLIESYLSELPPDDISQGVDGLVVLQAIEAQHGLIIERAHEIHSFSHLTLHEYFAAKKIVESTKGDEIVALMRAKAIDDQWREVVLMVSSLLDDGRFLIDAFAQILGELSGQFPRISTLVAAAIESRRDASGKARHYGYGKQRRVSPEGGDAIVIGDSCITIAGNMRVLGIEERFVALPRMIASAFQADPYSITRHLGSDPASLKAAKSFFRLAALTSECLMLTALPSRKAYLQRLFDPIRPPSH
jgi:predicted NACHT family NTPase